MQVANVIASRIGYVDKLLTEEEVTLYLFQAKNLGRSSVCAKDVIKSNSEYSTSAGGVMKEVFYSLASLKQPFMRGLHRRTIPLQFCYLTLTLTTGVMTWWTKIFQMLDLQTDAYVLSFGQTLSQIPGMILASGLIDSVGRRQLVIIGFGGGGSCLFLLSMMANTIQQHAENGVDSDSESEDGGVYHSVIVLLLSCLYTICLCVGWLSLDCLSAESFPTKIRSTGRGVCVATGRLAGFCVQFLYGPLISQNRLSYMLGLAGLFAVGGVAVSCQTTDTTNVDLQDHWDYSTSGDASDKDDGEDTDALPTRRTSLVETAHID